MLRFSVELFGHRENVQNANCDRSCMTCSNGFRSGQNRDPTGDRPTFVGSSVGSVWIWQCPIDSPVTASVGPKKPSVHVSSRSWSDWVGSVQLAPNIREISVGYESQSRPTGILLCGCHTWGCNGEVVY